MHLRYMVKDIHLTCVTAQWKNVSMCGLDCGRNDPARCKRRCNDFFRFHACIYSSKGILIT